MLDGDPGTTWLAQRRRRDPDRSVPEHHRAEHPGAGQPRGCRLAPDAIELTSERPAPGSSPWTTTARGVLPRWAVDKVAPAGRGDRAGVPRGRSALRPGAGRHQHAHLRPASRCEGAAGGLRRRPAPSAAAPAPRSTSTGASSRPRSSPAPRSWSGERGSPSGSAARSSSIVQRRGRPRDLGAAVGPVPGRHPRPAPGGRRLGRHPAAGARPRHRGMPTSVHVAERSGPTVLRSRRTSTPAGSPPSTARRCRPPGSPAGSRRGCCPPAPQAPSTSATRPTGPSPGRSASA